MSFFPMQITVTPEDTAAVSEIQEAAKETIRKNAKLKE